MLQCLEVALLYSRDEGGCGDLSDAAAVARDLVAQSVERLDSATIGPLMKAKKTRGRKIRDVLIAYGAQRHLLAMPLGAR